VLKKSKKDNSVLFIDASAESIRPGNKNKLSELNQLKIFDAYVARKDADHFAKLVPTAELADTFYNLSVTSHVKAENTLEAVDITPLNAEIARIVARQNQLRQEVEAIIGDLEDQS
jgi:type I restriction enzyme M protein